MTDTKKVIRMLNNTLRHCHNLYNHVTSEEQTWLAEINQGAKEALELLKEQEPILLENQHKPYGNSLNANAPWISRCPKCGKKIEGKQTRYCKYCGQAVKHNGSSRGMGDDSEA